MRFDYPTLLLFPDSRNLSKIAQSYNCGSVPGKSFPAPTGTGSGSCTSSYSASVASWAAFATTLSPGRGSRIMSQVLVVKCDRAIAVSIAVVGPLNRKLNHMKFPQPSRFFVLAQNRGMIFVVFAMIWPFIYGSLFLLWQYHYQYIHNHFLPNFHVIRHGVPFWLCTGTLGSFLMSSYVTLARLYFRPGSTWAKRICLSSVVTIVIAAIIFSWLLVTNTGNWIGLMSGVVLGYLGVILNVCLTSTELGKRYFLKDYQPNRNNTLLAWAAFLFSISLVLIVGFFTWVIYLMILM